MFKAITAAKFVVSGIVGIGTGKIVSGVVKSVVTPTTLIDKVTIAAATWVVSGMVSQATQNYTDDTIDKAVTLVTQVTTRINQIKLAGKLDRINNNQSTFETEGLDPAHFQKNEEGRWVPIPETVIIEETVS